MKYLITLLFAFMLIVPHAQAQDLQLLFNKNWKVEFSKLRLHADEHYMYHVDSATNQRDYKNLDFIFDADGNYKIKSSTDEDAGSWASHASADSFLLDNGRYFIQTLNAHEFELVGYAIRPNAASILSPDFPNNIVYDTIYNYFKLVERAALPVNFAGFTAMYKHSKVLLDWSTASENNNSHFEVEYSSDNKQYKKIGNVPGNGTTSILHNYLFATNSFQQGDNFYRIKHVDLDGKFSYSTIAVLHVEEIAANKLLSVAPNPATSFINLNWKGSAGTRGHIILTDFTGRVVWNTGITLKAGDNILNLPAIAKAIYVLTIKDAQGNVILKDKLLVQ